MYFQSDSKIVLQRWLDSCMSEQDKYAAPGKETFCQCTTVHQTAPRLILKLFSNVDLIRVCLSRTNVPLGKGNFLST